MVSVRTVAVIGAGVMGRGIAQAAALAGYRTILEDILPATLRQAGDEIRGSLGKSAEAGGLSREQATAALARLEYAGSVDEAAREAEFVIEAVPEEMESKIEIFTMLDKICRPGTILGSSTSSLSLTEIASVTYRASRIVGLRFVHPVEEMALLEIVRGLETDDETIAAARDLGSRMGKQIVVARETPGTVVGRMEALIANEAFYMLQEGLASAEDIDRAVRCGLKQAKGPFELADAVGLDTRLHVLEELQKNLGDKFRPCPLLRQYVKAGRLGRKSGQGVYHYPETAKRDTTTEAPAEAGDTKPAPQ